MKLNKRIILISSLFVALFSNNAIAGDVIAHPSFPGTKMSAEEVQNVFLGRQTSVQGTGVVLVYQTGGPVKERFDANVLKRPGAQLDSYWAKLVFTGRAKAPTKKSNDEEVLSYVKSTPGAIGYVDKAPPGVKVLFSF